MTMTIYAQSLNSHYGQADLEASILAALERAGKDLNALARDDLASFDEFHIRGRPATRELAQLAGLREGMEVLDLGCGVGGPARTLAAEFGCVVTGIDIVEEYCRAARMLTERVGLSHQVTFRHGDVMDMPFDDASFDVVWSQHTIMNVQDKGRLFTEVRRVLRPGGRLVLYEVCAGSVAPPFFPVPWAGDPSISFLVDPGDLRRMLSRAGFRELMWRDVSRRSLESFRTAMTETAARPVSEPRLPGLSLLMGPNTRDKITNIRRNLEEDRIRVVQNVLELAG